MWIPSRQRFDLFFAYNPSVFSPEEVLHEDSQRNGKPGKRRMQTLFKQRKRKREYDCEPIESVVLEPKLFFIGCPLLKT